MNRVKGSRSDLTDADMMKLDLWLSCDDEGLKESQVAGRRAQESRLNSWFKAFPLRDVKRRGISDIEKAVKELVKAEPIEAPHGVDNAAEVNTEPRGDACGKRKRFHMWDERGDRKKSKVYPSKKELHNILFEFAEESLHPSEELPLVRHNRQSFMMKLMPEIEKEYKDLEQLSLEVLYTEEFKTFVFNAADRAYCNW